MSDQTPNEPKELNLRELINLLQKVAEQAEDNSKIGIPYSPGYATIGASPIMPITGVNVGFDWNSGRVFITPKERLGAEPTELIQKMRQDQNATGRFLLDLRRVMRDDNLSDQEKLIQMDDILKIGPKRAAKPQVNPASKKTPKVKKPI